MGNTCYMNSALQCLSHTTPLARYFLRDQIFKNELNPKNPMASQNNEITIHFTKFLHQMWNKAESGSYSWDKNVFSPDVLKKAIGKKNELFKGTQQNDTNEFLQFLLDQLHEDLNRVKDKPYLTMPSDLKILGYNDL